MENFGKNGKFWKLKFKNGKKWKFFTGKKWKFRKIILEKREEFLKKRRKKIQKY